ncbi:MAG: response regulator, partial [Anaerolineae bacterium]|nr:response regulator [Anaerolineae bacterium]
MPNERILVVDDEPGVVRSCVRILERQGFKAVGYTDSQAVPDLLRREVFDLLLTDIRMPKIDGLALLEIATEINPYLTVILITGYGTMEDAIKAIRLGAQGFIMKPFEPSDLVTTIQDCLARRAMLRDSMRLQSILPLLEINEMLQVSGGEMSLAQRVLEIAQHQTNAARLAWLSLITELDDLAPAASSAFTGVERLREMAVVPHSARSEARLPNAAIEEALKWHQAIWLLADGNFVRQLDGQPNIVGAVLPLLIKGQVVGVLTAEAGNHGQSGPFDPISLDLLSVLAGQLAIIIENAQLFRQAETLRAFNDDIIQTMTNGLIAIDRQGRVTAFNPAAAIMLGEEIDKVLHQPITEALKGSTALVDLFYQTLSSGRPQAHHEIVAQHWDGNQLPIAVSVAPLTGGDYQHPLTGAVGVLEDLSDIKALEAKRRRLDRLAALGEMSAVVAHEIRNPIAGIAAGVEYLTRKIPKDSPEYEGTAMILGEIERVNRILEDILFVARPLQLNLSEEKLPELINAVIQRYQPQITASQLAVTFEHEAELPLVKVDRQRLEQVFSNLILNATQAVYRGELSVQLKRVRSGR